jgi:hypothetical protein
MYSTHVRRVRVRKAPTEGFELIRRTGETESAPATPMGFVPTSFATRGPKTTANVDWERIFVLNDRNEIVGEYALNDDCPIENADLMRSLPMSGMHHLVSFYQGEYAFTPFRVDTLWFVLVTRGIPRIEDRGSIGTLLAAARLHIPVAIDADLAKRDLDMGARERFVEEREAGLAQREELLDQTDTHLQLTATRLREREADLLARETKLNALRDYAVELQKTLVPPRSAKSRDDPA